MTLLRLTDTESLTPPEAAARARHSSPGPFQDAVANMFIRNGVSATTTAQFYGIGLREVNAIVTWVAETNLRRLMQTPPPWSPQPPPDSTT